jgi:hypothetical protein
MSTHDENEISRFFSSIQDWANLFESSTLTFLALKNSDKLVLLHAQVTLIGNWGGVKEKGLFETDRLLVGHVSLQTAGLTPQMLVDGLRCGTLRGLGRDFDFPRDATGLSATFLAFDPDSVSLQKRVPKLILSGRLDTPAADKLSLDWHLRPLAYDSVEDLCATYGVGTFDLWRPLVEIRSVPVVEIHGTSTVSEGLARLAIGLPADADTGKALIAYRVFSGGQLHGRQSVSGSALNWQKTGAVSVGSTELEVPKGAAVQCFACYAGVAQHSLWVGDLKYAPNLRRLIFDGVDEGLEVIKDFLFEEKKPRKEARDLEAGVSWLLWMSGFAVLHPGTKRLEDNVDVIAVTPSSKIALVECTTGLLTREGKLPALQHRIAALRKRLAAGGFGHLPVLGVGVTTKSSDEITADVLEAAKGGILLLSADELRTGLERTLVPQDPDALFEQGLERVRSLAHDGGLS